MAEVTAASITIASSGNEKVVTADLSSVGSGDTWTVPHITKITHWNFQCTTEANDLGGTIAANVITFATSTSIIGTCRVWGI